jgi:pimeloyl-ACP methyl ester carboxylesterase
LHLNRRHFFAGAAATALGTNAMSQTNTAQAAPAHLSASATGPFSTQPWGPGSRIDTGGYSVQRVTFKSGGLDVVGNLFLPAGPAKKPAVAVIGPVAYIKEQAPLQYASRLAMQGFATLIFDPRFHGESAGEPRRFESRASKVEDLRAAVSFLENRPEIDANRIHLLGVCQGVNWAIEAAADDPVVRSVSIVAGHYLVPETALLYLGSPENVAARLAKARESRGNFLSSGSVDYIPIVSLTDRDALLTAKPIYDFYYQWADRGPFSAHRGLWENRITRMSEADIWGHKVDEQLKRLKKPVLMVHSDKAASGPNIPRQLFDVIAASDKRAVWLEGRNQIQFYQDPLTIDMVTPHLAKFYAGTGA